MAIFYNQATLSFNGFLTNSNTTQGEILDAVGITKTAISPDYSRGDGVAYAISITNSGTGAINNLSVTDNLGAYAFGTGSLTPLEYTQGSLKLFIDGTLADTPTVTAGESLTVSGIDIPAGGNALILYEARANEFAPLTAGSTITNSVSAGGDALDGATATETVPVREEPILSITKVMTPDTVTENGELTYTFIIQNTGNTATVATDDVTVSDLFNPILDNLSVTFNGTEWAEGANYTYNNTTGEFTTLPGQITVPAATFVQDALTGVITVTPGVSIIEVRGTV